MTHYYFVTLFQPIIYPFIVVTGLRPYTAYEFRVQWVITSREILSSPASRSVTTDAEGGKSQSLRACEYKEVNDVILSREMFLFKLHNAKFLARRAPQLI